MCCFDHRRKGMCCTLTKYRPSVVTEGTRKRSRYLSRATSSCHNTPEVSCCGQDLHTTCKGTYTYAPHIYTPKRSDQEDAAVVCCPLACCLALRLIFFSACLVTSSCPCAFITVASIATSTRAFISFTAHSIALALA